jgi:hypothetical protein
MTYRGRIKNGMAVLDTPIPLPDGTPVRVEVEPAGSDFWHGRTVEELARDQGIQAITSLNDLVVDWPEDDPIDDLLALVREVRR